MFQKRLSRFLVLSLSTLSAHAIPAKHAAAPASNESSNALSSTTFQATLTGYGPRCAVTDAGYGSCGFHGTPNSFQAAVSTYWNTDGLPGQCGTCRKLSNAHNTNGDGTKGSPISTAPIVVMVDNTCAKDLKKPGFQCNQNQHIPKDKFEGVTVVELCHDTGAPEAFWRRKSGEGQTEGSAVAEISQVDCEEWQGSLDRLLSWTKYKLGDGSQKQVEVKPGH